MRQNPTPSRSPLVIFRQTTSCFYILNFQEGMPKQKCSTPPRPKQTASSCSSFDQASPQLTEGPFLFLDQHSEFTHFQGGNSHQKQTKIQPNPYFQVLESVSLGCEEKLQSDRNDGLKELLLKAERVRKRRGERNTSTLTQKMGDVLHLHRIKNICINVARKLVMNNIHRPSLAEADLKQFEREHRVEGIFLPKWVKNIWDTFSAFTMLGLILMLTFIVGFPELKYTTTISALLILGIVSISGQILLQFVLVRSEQGRKIRILAQIIRNYLQGYFLIHLSILACLILYFSHRAQDINHSLLCLLLTKVSSLMGKLESVERLLIKKLYYERYWSLIKIFLFNLVFAHAIAITLNFMLKEDRNWQISKGIDTESWTERYIWSYYWATTIMLTVGFGDYVPTTSQEAVWIIAIEIISCIAFSYNISCFGSIITSIRSQGEQINKNKKIFQNFAEKSNLTEELKEKILHYIDESVKVKTRFNIAEEKDLIQRLPQGYKAQVLSQSNKILLKTLPFFNQIHLKTICQLSKKIEKKIYYPSETIKVLKSDLDIFILQKGEVGFSCHSPGSALNRIYGNTIKIDSNQTPFLLNTDFLTYRSASYDIRSKDYSVVHKLSYQDFRQTLRNVSKKDYEYYCFLKDRSSHILDEYQTIQCKPCHQKHTIFTCPRYHFTPLKGFTVQKYLYKRKQKESRRQIHTRASANKCNSLALFCVKSQAIDKASSPSLVIKESCSESLIYSGENSSSPLEDYQIKRLITSSENHEEEHLTLLLSNLMLHQMKKDHKLKEEQCEDQIWLLSSDKSYDFTTYFPSSNLKSIFASRKKKLKKLRQLSTDEPHPIQ